MKRQKCVGGLVINRGAWIVVLILTVIVMCSTGCGGHVGINSGGGGAINCGGCGATSGGSGGTGGVGAPSGGQVNVSLIDPPTCVNPRSAFTHVYVSVQSVQMSPTANATTTSTDWVEVLPALNTAPKQIDLFNPGTALGNLNGASTGSMAAGTYQTLRMILAPNSATIVNNQCGAAANCATYGGQTIPIDVAGESTKGIILSGIVGGTSTATNQLKDGAITVASSGVTNVNVMLDSCASLIGDPTSSLRLVPKAYAWAGNVHSVQVTLSDATTGARIGSGDAIVAFEKSYDSSIEHPLFQGSTDGAGQATFTLPDGTFDVVAVATSAAGGTSRVIYSPVVVTGFDTTGTTSALPIVMPQAGIQSPAMIAGTITAQGAATGPDMRIGVVQRGTFGGTLSNYFTIPILDDWSSMSTTTVGNGCAAGSSCAAYSLTVPGQPLYLRPATSTSPAVVSTDSNDYVVDAIMYLTNGAGAKDCSVTENQARTTDAGANITLGPGAIATAASMTFTGCQ